VTERSTHFAEFNRRLNAIENLTAARGDLYEPAGELTFDRIVAHPPYVPMFRRQLVFDSGGQDGEQVVRGIIQGLPRHLRPGGRFYALTGGTDRERPFEHRIRAWLGEAESEFDVAFVVRKTWNMKEYTAEAGIRYRGTAGDIKSWRETLDHLHVEQLSYGFLTIQRRDRKRPVFTVRRQTGVKTGPAEHHWLVEWETAAVSVGAEALLGARPKAAGGARLRVEHRLSEDGWIPEGYQYEIDHPFNVEMRAQAWTGHLLALADGSRSGADLLDQMKSDGALHRDTPPLEFANVLAMLVSGGFLQI
jgi:hypothetical protein